jgi:regulator of sigma E protease
MFEAVQTGISYVGAFLVVLTLVTFVHEWGHFAAARACGIRVDTFCFLGWGKPIWSVMDKQGTRWAIAPIPIGAYVQFAGDANMASMAADETQDAQERRALREQGYFYAQPVAARAITVAAGPFANFAFSTLVFAALFLAFGKDITSTAELSARIDSVQAGSPAERAGLKPGDVVAAIDGRPVAAFGDMQSKIVASPGQTLTFTVLREGGKIDLSVTPEAREGVGEGGESITRGAVGVGRTSRPEERKIQQYNPISAIGAGAEQVWKIIATTVAYIGNIITGQASAEHLAGPLGIMDQSGKVLEGSLAAGGAEASLLDRMGQAAIGLLQWAAILSVAVGFVNLLPVPMLDGGHLVFYGAEALRGRPLSARIHEYGLRAGLAFVATLFLFATWNDLQRLNVLEFLSGILS